MKTYTELLNYNTYEKRLEYLMLFGNTGEYLENHRRWVLQDFYKKSREWKKFRQEIIVRDMGCDLALEGYEILGRRNILIHHLNPITENDVIDFSDQLVDPENVVCVSLSTHNAIHYGRDVLNPDPIERKPNDTIPWL